MTPDSPLRAQADNRLTDTDAINMQTSLFDADLILLMSQQKKIILC
ncbi:MAG: hypothetical protein IPK77_13985 [Cellvibrio sp.]|nr:hypothetical protein [Cellvibrio sp.]